MDLAESTQRGCSFVIDSNDVYPANTSPRRLHVMPGIIVLQRVQTSIRKKDLRRNFAATLPPQCAGVRRSVR